MLAIEKSKDLI
jgi:hypothetical protein